MTRPVFSPSWYRVAALKPRLRGHARIARHRTRGETWYILQDRARGQFYRFTPEAYQVIGRMDGEHTVQELWEDAAERFGDDAPTQGEMVQILSQLHGADVLLADVPPDTAELLKRSRKAARARWARNLRTPLAIRLPIWDPDRFLTRTLPLVRPLLGAAGGVAWLALVLGAVVAAAMHWSALTEDIMARVLTAQSLLVIWAAYPVVKVLHELGHGYLVKMWGGEVHEMGIMLLVLMPIPYVDASAASEFRSRARRALVGAAGIMVELLVAAVALFFWLNLEAGFWRTVAYNIVLIGSVSTVLFNANPLLRYDGYYILADLLDIPNLAQRGTAYLGYLVRRHLMGVRKEEAPHTAPGEGRWLALYTVAAFLYRMFVYVTIVLFIAGKFFFVGIVLALWAAASMVVTPLFKGVKFLVASPRLQEHRLRGVAVTVLALAGAALILFAVPLPSRTLAEGVVWVPDESLVRAGADGFVSRIVAEPGRLVAPGDLLMECRDPLLESRLKVLEARLGELQARYDAARALDQVQARLVAEELAGVQSEAERVRQRRDELAIRSPAAGRFVLPRAADLPGRYLSQGSLVGYVLDVGRPTVRVVVPQSRIDLVRQRVDSVAMRPAQRIRDVVPAVIRREVPGARQELPSAALGRAGGGRVLVDPSDQEGLRTFERIFQFDLEPAGELDRVYIGGRVHVLFDHGTESLAAQIYRGVRQLFLRRFNV